MAIALSNGSFRIGGGSLTFSEPLPPLGQVARVFNSGSSATTYQYVDIFGVSQFSVPIDPLEISYVYAQPSSFVDNIQSGEVAVTDLIITSTDSLVVPTFTEVLLTTPGAGNWTKPAGVTEVIVECWGGGGAGGGATINDNAGNGGGAGSFSRKLITYTSPEASIPYSIAASVTGIAGNGPIGNNTTWQTSVVVAKGGSGGIANDVDLFTPPIANGTSNVGDIVYEGADGQQAITARGQVTPGSGGTHYGSVGTTFNTLEYGGLGGDFASTVQGNGIAGSIYGAGGSGAYKTGGANKTGGNGAQGLIRVIYR